ncbi:Phosphoprotein phosphatase [Bathymodiolus thermophilus thioautotrophic gill symbiont]|uniref:metallophosphoesterase n=1 Tax=Bathymodiolus thermophilus thioautotrophic gill symbiont TaxID=2360 RepID=UPI0010B81390|nr:metallophosphoesterase [Bathymodiolus thermophilus thioautotrophic gill symbiont]CAB5505508.1 hypothetical protein THERMOT_2165 [Bathymodiolus thermophilus thioautotrophic gill symbiont]SGZ76964.1 Phosphoprotein phosphatase [Bathymodiolus thermophilus thioautotrophic gill symbiont]
MNFSKFTIAISLLLLSSLPYAQSPYRWVQMAANNQLSVRAILLNDKQCPVAHINNVPTMMKLRAPKVANFPAVCELLVSRDTHSIKIQQRVLPTLPSEVNRVAILGDTGCRIKKTSVQDCNDVKAWPFRELSASIASKTPDIILHVGDYFYRETPCPKGNKGCKGSPSGYNWDTWNADWFTPASSLFQSAVIAFSRGNHENCSRAKNGWSRYLSPWAYTGQTCAEMEKPYMFKLKNVNYIMFDSSYGQDDRTSDTQLALYKKTIEQLKLDKDSTNIVLTHRPMWTYNKIKSKYYYGNLTQQMAFKNLLPNRTLFIAGHAHYLQVLDMHTDYDQLIVGNSGTALYKVGNTTKKSVDINKHKANFVYSRSGFGYGILTNKGKVFRFYNQKGSNVGKCIWFPNKRASLICQ